MRCRSLLFALISLLALTACAGGGSSGTGVKRIEGMLTKEGGDVFSNTFIIVQETSDEIPVQANGLFSGDVKTNSTELQLDLLIGFSDDSSQDDVVNSIVVEEIPEAATVFIAIQLDSENMIQDFEIQVVETRDTRTTLNNSLDSSSSVSNSSRDTNQGSSISSPISLSSSSVSTSSSSTPDTATSSEASTSSAQSSFSTQAFNTSSSRTTSSSKYER